MFKVWDNVKVAGVDYVGLVVQVIKRVTGEPVYVVAIVKTGDEFACDGIELEKVEWDGTE
ncbi:Hypothetical Protein OBI_RACECAR_262 [Arthrobacter phage Racecar]|nr:hypothetical protein PBI_RACECAR_54 [Arthrobacter phage Racecar]QFG12738.1 hypothetical protein PBI_MIMI_54 [Arthrobacter phage Mimi]